MNRLELYEIAKKLNIKGRSGMSKEELHNAIYGSKSSKKRTIYSRSKTLISPRTTFVAKRKFIGDFKKEELQRIAEELKVDFASHLGKEELYDILVGPDLDYYSTEELIETALEYKMYSFRETKNFVILKLAERIEKTMFEYVKISNEELLEKIKKYPSKYLDPTERNNLIFRFIKKSLSDVPIHTLKYRKMENVEEILTFYDTQHPPYKIREVLKILDRIEKEIPLYNFQVSEKVKENPLFNRILQNELSGINVEYIS